MSKSICTVPDCGKTLVARGVCAMHYRRMREGRPLDAPIRTPRIGCNVGGCERKHHSKGMCAVHYRRSARGTGLEAPIRGERGTCSVDGCEKPTDARGFCNGHYQRWKKGKPIDGALYTIPEVIKYSAVHKRIAKQRGRAAELSCADCSCTAEHWSYRHDCPKELIDAELGAYCLHPEHYDPRCAKCHKRFDG